MRRRFGPYGGRYVPETLIPALDELEQAWLEARADPEFTDRLERLLRDYVGRPTPLYRAAGLSEVTGAEVWLKREDLTHTGSHKINNALGQSLLAQRMGKPRVIAETGAGQHGVAAATACALLDLDCVVYMGTEDMRRQRPNVERMRLLGAEVVGVEAGARTLKEAASAAIRDWVGNVETTHYVIGSAVGPAPFPALVRDLQRRIGDEARAQLLEAAGRLPDRVIACVGGGSNAIGTFAGFVDDAEVALVGVEAAGEGLETRRHSAPLTTGARGVLHGALSAVLQDEEGQILEAHSISAGLDYPGRRPRARLPARQRAGQLRGRPGRGRPGRLPARRRARGDPAGAGAGARGRLGAGQPRRGGEPGPDNAVGTRRQRPRRGARARLMSVVTAGADRIAAAFASHGKRAALMPYLMGGYTSLDASAEAGLAAAAAGADLIELGIPFSDPLADGPVIHAAGTAALAAGATPHGTLSVCERISAEVPVVLMVYVNLVLSAGAQAFALRAAAAGASGLIVPDLPHDEADEVRAACDAEGLALVPLVAPTTTPERVAEIGAERARVRLHGVADRHHRRARRAATPAGGDGRARARLDGGAGGGWLRHLDGRPGGLRRRAGGRRHRGDPDRARGGRGRSRGGRGGRGRARRSAALGVSASFC